ncbi:pectate lyase family protein [Micromonospora sp. NBC_01813]|uniref:pectate lyase family protein n=1 Tax=Micromonospora sp. NBC_01813 TaxID=2975988 RepID=UPI002DD88DD7|nr:cellulose binding domain-containing protein [Micromonospora sp. NBC_01813]WSA11636.1 cellulose binding domain-containing protein [Micromonospora sp. NBC_01813]
MRAVPRRLTLATTAAAITTIALTGAAVLVATTAHAATGCRVGYSIGSQWPGGFTGNLEVTNLGDPLSTWTLRWTFGGGQQVVQAWNAEVSQSGSTVTASNVSWNGSLGTNASTSFGFNGSWNNTSNPAPSDFTLNGVACTGSANPTTGAPAPTTPAPTTPAPTAPAPTTPPPGQTPTGIIGWATQNGGTTGGGNASTTTVTTAAALTTAAGATGAAVIRISGTITCSGMIRIRDNKTILGVGTNATLSGCGLTINGNRNVIIRNINFRNWADDAINVEGNATNIWIDHNSLTNGYDGAIDIKRGSDYITVSWNRIFGHDKSMLLGHSDDNASQDIGHLRVSYHHNWFDGTNQRHPRVRFGNPVHVFNNFYGGVTGYGIASTMNAGVLVEGNYFENTADPYHLGEGSSGPGSLVARNNHFVNSGNGQTGGSVAAIPYSYTLTTPSQVKSVVTNGAGTGRIGL